MWSFTLQWVYQLGLILRIDSVDEGMSLHINWVTIKWWKFWYVDEFKKNTHQPYSLDSLGLLHAKKQREKMSCKCTFKPLTICKTLSQQGVSVNVDWVNAERDSTSTESSRNGTNCSSSGPFSEQHRNHSKAVVLVLYGLKYEKPRYKKYDRSVSLHATSPILPVVYGRSCLFRLDVNLQLQAVAACPAFHSICTKGSP